MPQPLESRLLQSFQDAAVVAPNDSVDIARPANAIYVGTAGNIVLRTMGGTTLTFLAVPAGILDVQTARILNTNTTAAGIVALYTTIA